MAHRDVLTLEDAWILLTKHYGSEASTTQETLTRAIDIAERSAWPCAERVVETIEKSLSIRQVTEGGGDDVNLKTNLLKFVHKVRLAHSKLCKK